MNARRTFPQRARRVPAIALSLAAAVAALALAATASARPAAARAATFPGCHPTVTILPDLGHGSGAFAISNGTVVGSVFDAAGTQLPAVWRNGQLTLIGGVTSGYAGDINPRGEIVGNADSFSHPFAVVGAATALLPHPDGFAYARRINARGQIAGAVGNDAARWDSYLSQPVALMPAAGDAYSFSKGINDVGAVAGDTDDANFVPRSAIWNRAGQIRVLPSAFGADQPGDLFAINNAGVSTGESYAGGPFGPTADQATRWSRDGVPTLIPFLPGTNLSTGLELNDRGWVGGVALTYDYGTGDISGSHAFVWFGTGAALTLPVPGLSYAASESDVHFITNHGTAVGSFGPAGGPDAATVWTCIQTAAYAPAAGATVPRRVVRHARPLGWGALAGRLGESLAP